MVEHARAVVIGGGVVGTAVARHLGGFDLSVALIEARGDIGDATSKANTAILHTGFDAVPGSLESRLVREGYRLLSDYARATGIPVERVKVGLFMGSAFGAALVGVIQTILYNSAQVANRGTGTMKFRRAKPTSPSTPPLSLPLPGRP